MLRNGSLATQSCTISQLNSHGLHSLSLNSLGHLWPVLIALLLLLHFFLLLLQAKLSLAAFAAAALGQMQISTELKKSYIIPVFVGSHH